MCRRLDVTTVSSWIIVGDVAPLEPFFMDAKIKLDAKHGRMWDCSLFFSSIKFTFVD